MPEISERVFQTRFRILKIAGKRKAFRLEEVFWNFLQRLAEAEQISLSKYLEKFLAPHPDVNAAAFLRAHVAERGLELVRDNDALLRRASDLLLISNAPMFMMGEGKKIISTNPAMQSFLVERLGSAQVRMSFGVDLDQVYDDLETGRTRIARVPCDVYASARRLRGLVVMVLICAFGDRRRIICAMDVAPQEGDSGHFDEPR